MTNIGYATLSIIPSLDGVSKSVQKQLGALDGKKFGKEFGKDLAKGVQSSEADVKKAFNNHAKLADRAADATGKLKVAQAGYQDLVDKGVKSGQRFERAKQQIEKATRDEARMTRQATDALKDYEKAQKRAGDGIENIGSGLGDKLKSLAGDAASGGTSAATSFVEGFGGPVAAIGTKAGPIGVALTAAAALATGAGVLIGKNVMAGMERELNADRIQAQLGMTDAQAKKFGETAGRIYGKAFGDSMPDVQQATADVASTLDGASDAVLEDMTAKALTLRDVYGTDLAESIALAQNMVVNGLAPDAASAFDLMTTSLERVPAALRDETFEALTEYSAHLSGLGFTGEQAAGMIVGVADQGKYAIDKLGDSLKEFGIKAQDLEDTGAQGILAALGLNGQDVANNLLAGGEQAANQFSEIVDLLLGIQDPADQAAAAIALFGTPLEDLGKHNIPAFLQSLSNSEAAMQGWAGSAQQMVDTAASNTATTVEGAKRQIDLAVAEMQTSLAQAFGPTIEQIANWLKEHKDEIVGFFTTAANAGAEFGAAVTGMASVVLRAFGLVTQGIGDAVGFMHDAFEKIVGAAATVAEKIPGLGGLASDLREAQSSLKDMAEEAHSWGDSMLDMSDTLFEASTGWHNFDANLGTTSDIAWDTVQAVDGLRNSMAGLAQQSASFGAGGQGALPLPATMPGGLTGPGGFGTSGQMSGGTAGGRAGQTLLPPGTTRPVTPFTLPSSTTASGGGSSSGSVRKVGSDSGLLPHTIGVKDTLATQFTDVTDIGGWRPPDGYNEHSSGRAIDVMIPNWQTAAGQAYGDQVTAEALKNPNVQYVLWKQTQWNADGSSKGMEDRGNPTQNHFDHAHVYTYPEPRGAHPTGTPQSLTAGGVGGAGMNFASIARGGTGGGPAPGPGVASGGRSSGGGSGLGFNVPSSLSGFGESFGGAIGSAIDGQVSSALGVLGVPQSPGWLQGVSTFVNGLSIQGGPGGGAAPAAARAGVGGGAAAPTAAAAGLRGGGGGPSTVYNIRTATVEDAFMAAQRKQNELALARLSSR